jgi:hypothetical protein
MDQFFSDKGIAFFNYLIIEEREKQANQGSTSLSRTSKQHKKKSHLSSELVRTPSTLWFQPVPIELPPPPHPNKPNQGFACDELSWLIRADLFDCSLAFGCDLFVVLDLNAQLPWLLLGLTFEIGAFSINWISSHHTSLFIAGPKWSSSHFPPATNSSPRQTATNSSPSCYTP